MFLFARVWNTNTAYFFDLPAECSFKGWKCFEARIALVDAEIPLFRVKDGGKSGEAVRS